MTTPVTADALTWMHPMRVSRLMFSTAFNPWMAGIASLAASIRGWRQPLPDNHPARLAEDKAVADATRQIEAVRKARDAALEQMFGLLFGRNGEVTGSGASTTRQEEARQDA